MKGFQDQTAPAVLKTFIRKVLETWAGDIDEAVGHETASGKALRSFASKAHNLPSGLVTAMLDEAIRAELDGDGVAMLKRLEEVSPDE